MSELFINNLKPNANTFPNKVKIKLFKMTLEFCLKLNMTL